MANEVLARLDADDLLKWQRMAAELYALQYNPDVFTKEESIRIAFQRYEHSTQLQEKYCLPEDEEWHVDPNTGRILVSED